MKMRWPISEEQSQAVTLGHAAHGWTADKAVEMQSEIDTMSFVREHTNISIPRVFASDTTATNPVGAPFMLMSA
jgi:hypothetical protein